MKYIKTIALRLYILILILLFIIACYAGAITAIITFLPIWLLLGKSLFENYIIFLQKAANYIEEIYEKSKRISTKDKK